MIRKLLCLVGCIIATAASAATTPDDPLGLSTAQAAIVKVYGAGGVAGLEGYQTGLFIESSGTVLTVDSTVLEAGVATLVDAYGDRYEARVVGSDSETGLALLACPASVTPPGVLPVESAREPRRTEPVWALSNAFAIANGDEPVTAQRARLAAITPMPTSTGAERERAAVGAPRSGTTVLLLDAVTSNPGAGGGAVVGRGGVLLGVLGAERRSPLTGTWINYAVPTAAVRGAIDRIRSGGQAARAGLRKRGTQDRAKLRELGVVLIPAVTRRTPPFVERVTDRSAAHRGGLRSDDLIIEVDGSPVGVGDQAAAAIVERLANAEISVTVLRDQRVLTFKLTRVAP